MSDKVGRGVAELESGLSVMHTDPAHVHLPEAFLALSHSRGGQESCVLLLRSPVLRPAMEDKEFCGDPLGKGGSDRAAPRAAVPAGTHQVPGTISATALLPGF